MNFKQYIKEYPEATKWLMDNAPKTVIEAMNFAFTNEYTHIKLLRSIVETQRDFMNAMANYQSTVIEKGAADEESVTKYNASEKLVTRIGFLFEQYDTFLAENRSAYDMHVKKNGK